MINEKVNVAFWSIIAAIFLTVLKLVVGITTRSLGIISEAIHSAIDLGAALITFFAVKISDKPADETHHYGHGKIENISALIQTILLLFTCGWIIYEALHRIFETNIEVQVNIFSFLVIIVSIVVDIIRSTALMRAAKKYNSQALEADAYHFSSDILSSAVVIIGLISVKFGFALGDSIAALIVSAIIIVISLKLGKRTIEVLMDSAPKGMSEDIEALVLRTHGVVECSHIRVRASGSSYFVDINAGLDKHFSHKEIQDVIDTVKLKVLKSIPNCDVVISTYPACKAQPSSENDKLFNDIRAVVNSLGICINLHHIKIFKTDNVKHAALHIEVNEDMSLDQTHDLSHLIESKILSVIPEISQIDILVESMKQEQIDVEDVTSTSKDIVNNIQILLNKVPHKLNCHDIKVYKRGDKMVAFLHCGLGGEHSNEKIQSITKRIVNKIRRNLSSIEDVYIHVEPIKK